MRWTSCRARLTLRPCAGALRLQVTTNRRMARLRDGHFVVHTAWGHFPFPIRYLQWKEAAIAIPRQFTAYDAFEVELSTDDHWYPAEEIAADNDLRCLGVMLKVEDEAQSIAAPRKILPLPVGLDPYVWGDYAPVPGGMPIYAQAAE
jgi:hypothetical protein